MAHGIRDRSPASASSRSPASGRARSPASCSPTWAPTSSRSTAPQSVRGGDPADAAGRHAAAGPALDRRRPEDARGRRGRAPAGRARPTACSSRSGPASPSASASVPTSCLARNPKLVYGRMTGWGQDGPYAHTAGHDINYIALAGALFHFGRAGRAAHAADEHGRRLRRRRDAARLRHGLPACSHAAPHRRGPGRRRRHGRRRGRR